MFPERKPVRRVKLRHSFLELSESLLEVFTAHGATVEAEADSAFWATYFSATYQFATSIAVFRYTLVTHQNQLAFIAQKLSEKTYC
jgi:hypothetical protein